jgi:predicted GNAT family N-acyltransferase
MQFLNKMLTSLLVSDQESKSMRNSHKNDEDFQGKLDSTNGCMKQLSDPRDVKPEDVARDYDNYDPMLPTQTGYRIKVVRDFEDMAKVFAIRASACFSDPEHLYGKHFDGSDFSATHLIGYLDGEPVGTIRIRYFADFTRIERLCIRPTHRKSRMSFKLAKAAFAFCRDKGYKTLSGVAREELVPFWAMLGFKIDENQAPIYIYGQAHYEMKLIYTDAPNAVTMNSPPLQLLRPEGKWHAAGYHETVNVTKPVAQDAEVPLQRETPRAIALRLGAKKRGSKVVIPIAEQLGEGEGGLKDQAGFMN